MTYIFEDNCYYIPKILFQDAYYQDLSIDAIVVYTILKDKQKEVTSKGWIDSEGNIYLAYRLSEMQKMFGVGKKKMINILRMLENHKLIEREREGVFYGYSLPYRMYINEI